MTFARATYHVLVSLPKLQLTAYNVKIGNYGETSLDGLNVLAVGSFKGNIWAGDGTTKVDLALFFDERANEQQREALNMIFSGKAGGFMAEFAKLIGEVRGIEYAPIKFQLANDLSYWSAEIPGKVLAKAEALTGPTTPPGKRVQRERSRAWRSCNLGDITR